MSKRNFVLLGDLILADNGKKLKQSRPTNDWKEVANLVK